MKQPLPAWYADRDRAAELARNGDTAGALAILQVLYQQHPDNEGVVRDYAAVLSWAGGHDDQVISLYKTLPPNQPDYVLAAVGHSYRNLKMYPEAIAVYQSGLAREPSSETYAVGLIRCLTEAGYAENAMQQADANIQHFGYRLEIVMAGADAAEQFGQDFKALDYYQAAVRISPQYKQALQGLVRIEGRLGHPDVALKIADEHPGLIPPDEYRHLQGDYGAYLVRLGSQPAPSEAQRYAATDRAIIYLNSRIDEWSTQGPDAQVDIRRARLDRVMALVQRNLMQDAVSQYEGLVREGVSIPPYVLSSVGDAYMYLHEPEQARDIYLEVLRTNPKNFNARKQLFYAYTECDQWDEAFQVIDQLAAEQPYWIHPEGSSQQVINPRRVSTELAAGSARLMAGMVKADEERVMPVINAVPNQPNTREALGNIDVGHGWPRAALQQYQVGAQLGGGNDFYNEVGMAGAFLQLHRYPEAQNVTQDLVQRQPDSLAAQRAQHDWDVHNMAELRVVAGYQFRPDTTSNVTGGEGYGVDTTLYSSPFNYNWRIFAGEYYTHQHEPNQEGSIGFNRIAVGAEYRKDNLTAEVSPTFNSYHANGKVGIAGDASYTVNDHWTVAGSGEKLSRDTPLRAMNQGTTADEVTAHAVWHDDEEREVRFGGNIMPFSDGNLRTGLDAGITQRFYTIPDFWIDGLANAGESQNTSDTNRSYYNPGRDFIGLIGPRATQILFQRYATVWQHSLLLNPGLYWEQHYGTSAAFRMRYEHRIRVNDVFEAGAGFNFQRQAYDGVPENDYGVTLDVTARF